MPIISPLDAGRSYRDIEEKLGTPASTISRWNHQRVFGAEQAGAPPDGSTHWSLRKMATLMKVGKILIARIEKE
jgi:hypothetical protein